MKSLKYWSPWLGLFAILWLTVYAIFMPEPWPTFEKNWIFIFVGFGAAVLGNISAVGGGIIFIPSMIFIFHFAPVKALKIALASQVFGMTSGAVGWLQKESLPKDALKLTVPPLLLGSVLSSFVFHPNALLVKVLFGPVSVFLGCLTLVMAYRKKDAQPLAEIPQKARVPLFLTSFLGGLITGWIAIGEGELVAALLMLAYGVSTTRCIALGVLLLSINSIFLALIHQFYLGGIPWDVAAFTGLGCVFGARFSPYMSQKFNPLTLKYIFAIIAIGDGLLFIFQYVTKP